ncbi:hypothetical protein C1645_824848 [Glomus cerebriforme]|uniref:Uncharacterized protein n=1 Tax=Glomus cerebriforme TaxID=658196 RepID=A0A397STH5_9GLOM|nr:hypothetical protein C1645_824848 [Glomus cerebriforme]
MDCNICKPIRSDELDFSQVHSLPDPIPVTDKTSYKQFSDVYRFGPTAQFVRNVGSVIEYCECNKWHVLYSKSKLSSFEISSLERYLDTIQYVCGDSFEALANSRAEMENIEQSGSDNGDENSEHDDDGEIFKKVKVDDGLCEKVPEDGGNESDKVSVIEGYYYYCEECSTAASSKKKTC